MKKLVPLVYLFFCWISAFSQGGSPKPLPPKFDVLTLNPNNGVPTLMWTPPAYNPLYPNPTGYIIYKPMEGGGWVPIDTVESTIHTYTDWNSSGSQGSIRYQLASKGTTEPSQLTSPHGSIFLTVNYDSCNNKLDLHWSHYVGWGNRIKDYIVYSGTTPYWQDLDSVTTVPGNQSIANVMQIPPNRIFYLYVKARNEKDSAMVSLSNLARINTKVARKPSYMIVDSIIARDLHTEIRFKIDRNTEYRNFSLVRWETSDTALAIFTAKTLFEFEDPRTRSFIDESDAWTARSKPFFFKVDGKDGCNRLNVVSNLTNSITVRAATRGMTNSITWDTLYSKNMNPVRYNLYRVTYADVQYPPELIFSSDNELSFVDDLSNLEGQGLSPRICYYVQANEYVNDRPLVTSLSRMVCTEVIPDVIMPNAIDPLSDYSFAGHFTRNHFAPIITFKANYRLTIYNRWGGIIFNGTNEGWDGKLANGEYAKEGAYIYRLEVFSETKRTITKTGSLTVIYGPKR